MAYSRIRKWLRTGKGAIADGSGLGHFDEMNLNAETFHERWPEENCRLKRVGPA